MKRYFVILIILALTFTLPVVTPALAASLDLSALTETATSTETATPAVPFTCKVASISIVTNTETNVDVTCDGDTLTYTLTLLAAQTLGLVSTDAVPVVDESKIGTDVTINPEDMVTPTPTETPTETPTATPVPHPVGSEIADFFGLDEELVASLHEDGAGFGVIAQACWLSVNLAGDASLCEQIVEAKQSKDFSSIILEDGSTPSNWGQFRKAASGGEKKQNLGMIISGHAEPVISETPDPSETLTPSETPAPPQQANEDNPGQQNKAEKPEKHTNKGNSQNNSADANANSSNNNEGNGKDNGKSSGKSGHN